jgi:hypothetical protein
MNKKFMIHSAPGAGGMFLTSVFAKIMGIAIDTKISNIGDCHDFGNGVWNSSLIADKFDKELKVMKLTYHPELAVCYTHAMSNKFIKNYPDVQVLKIAADPAAYRDITRLAVKKAWPNLWTQEEYNKWVSPNYPPYSCSNIAESELICNDLINDLAVTQTESWFKQYECINYSHVIDFRTVMGIDDKNLLDEVKNITGGQITDDLRAFVDKYQQINKKLYFS